MLKHWKLLLQGRVAYMMEQEQRISFLDREEHRTRSLTRHIRPFNFVVDYN